MIINSINNNSSLCASAIINPSSRLLSPLSALSVTSLSLLVLSVTSSSPHAVTAAAPEIFHDHAKLLAEYPNHLNARCANAFDCDPQGSSLKCVPLSTIRDCIADCPNAADEKCGTNEVLCDRHLNSGCGKCAPKDSLQTYCADHRWQHLCEDINNYQCASTQNCILPQWLKDGVNDCADFSDEDDCLSDRKLCISNHTKEPTPATEYSFATDNIQRSLNNMGECLPDQFKCHNATECIPVAHVLDGHRHCADGSDEEFCQNNPTSCQDPFRPCSFNAEISSFTCGCTLGHYRTPQGICKPFNLPPNPADCADLQLHYKNRIHSGRYVVYNWHCANASRPDCAFQVNCDMQIFGGGWTVILQRMNLTKSFDGRTIDDYEKGFELDTRNFWIGLNQLHTLTNRPQCANELVIRLKTSRQSKIIIYRYSHFIINNKMTKFRLNLGFITYTNQPKNCVDELQDARMTAFEVARKECPHSSGGWWRRRCGQHGVLTGSNQVDQGGEYDDGLRWGGERLLALQMLIRPRGYIVPRAN